MGNASFGKILIGISTAAAMTNPTSWAAAQGTSQSAFDNVKTIAFASGRCTFSLNVTARTGCDKSIIFVTRKTGRSYFEFHKEYAVDLAL